MSILNNTFTQDRVVPFGFPEDARREPAKFLASVSLAKGQVIGEYTANPGVFGVYDPAAVDGREVPKGILEYAVVTDASAVITNLSGAAFNGVQNAAPYYYKGEFRTTDLAGNLAAALAYPGFGHVYMGNAANGIVRIG